MKNNITPDSPKRKYRDLSATVYKNYNYNPFNSKEQEKIDKLLPGKNKDFWNLWDLYLKNKTNENIIKKIKDFLQFIELNDLNSNPHKEGKIY
jgi:hypothetical protein